MKKAFVIFAAILVIAGAALGSGWQIISSWPTPGPNIQGLAVGYSPYNMAVLQDGNPPRVINLITPTQYFDIQVPAGVWGITGEGPNALWVSNYNNGYLYRLTTAGSLISSFHCTPGAPADLSRSASYPGAVWAAVPSANACYEFTSSGSVVRSFAGPGSALTAIEIMDPANDAIFGDPQTHRVYVVDYGTIPFGNPAAVDAGRTAGHPPWDPVYVVDGSSNFIMSYRYNGQPAVVPLSFGRVKAVYR